MNRKNICSSTNLTQFLRRQKSRIKFPSKFSLICLRYLFAFLKVLANPSFFFIILLVLRQPWNFYFRTFTLPLKKFYFNFIYNLHALCIFWLKEERKVSVYFYFIIYYANAIGKLFHICNVSVLICTARNLDSKTWWDIIFTNLFLMSNWVYLSPV